MRVLITGVSGLLGAGLALALSEEHDVVGCYHSTAVADSAFEAFACDLSASDAVAQLSAHQPDVIVHCAAATNVDACETNPAMAERVNVEGTRAAALAARESGARLITISTDAVFSTGTLPHKELDPVRPLNEYARTKLSAEHVTLSLGADALVVRTTIYGWNAQPKQSLTEWMLDSLRAGRHIWGFTDTVFAPILADDVCDALAALIREPVSGVLHVAGDGPLSKYDFAVMLAEVFGLDSSLIEPTTSSAFGLTAPRSSNMVLDCSLAKGRGLRIPTVREGLTRLKQLEEAGHAARLRSMVP